MNRLFLGVAAAVLVSCSSGTEVERVRVPGTIAGYFGGDPQITINQQGRTVSIHVVTYGPGCYRKGETEVEVEWLEANVRPYDDSPVAGSLCTRDLVSFDHTATLEFDLSGTARIFVHGLTTESDPYGEPITIELTVPIQ